MTIRNSKCDSTSAVCKFFKWLKAKFYISVNSLLASGIHFFPPAFLLPVSFLLIRKNQVQTICAVLKVTMSHMHFCKKTQKNYKKVRSILPALPVIQLYTVYQTHLYSARLLPGAAHPVAWQPTNTVSPKPNMLAGRAGCTWTWRSEHSLRVTHVQKHRLQEAMRQFHFVWSYLSRPAWQC